MTFSVDLCQSWARIGQLQSDAFEFQGIERYRELGEWSLTFPGNAASWSHFVNDAGDDEAYSPRDVDTIRLVEDNVIRYAGFVGEPSQGTGGVERILDASGLRWALSGPDLWDVLRTRIAFPVPATATPSSWASTHDVNSGVASTVLANYLSDNAGVTALAARTIDGFSVVDGVTGMSGDWSARIQPLYELARRILDDAELTIRFTVTFDGDITATIQRPRDLSEIHILSDQGDLTSVRSRLIPARSTWLLAGGSGTGTSRIFRTADSGESGLARRERFVDVSSLTQAAEVQASATANQRLDGETWVISGEVADSVTEAVGFGRTVFVGDKVTIQTDGQRFAVPVASIAWTIDAERQVVRPTLGEALPDALKGLLRDVGDLAARFENAIA